MTKSKIFLAEFTDEIDYFIKETGYDRNQGSSAPSQWTIVSLQPRVAAYCKTRGIPYVDTLTFFDNTSHRNALTCSHELARLIDRHLHFPADSSIKNTFRDTFIYYSRFYLTNFTWFIDILESITQQYPGSEIVVPPGEIPASPAPFPREGTPFLKDHDRFVASMAQRYCGVNNIKFSILGDRSPAPSVDAPAPVRTPGLLGRVLRNGCRALLARLLKKLSAKPVLFITAPSYNLDRLCRELMEKVPGTAGASVTFREFSLKAYLKYFLKGLSQYFKSNFEGEMVVVPMSLVNSAAESILSALIKDYRDFVEEHGQSFQYKDCSFIEEFNRKVENGLIVHLDYLNFSAVRQRSVLERLSPNIVIAPLAVGIDHGWAELGTAINIPTLVIPQKGLVDPHDEYARLEQTYIGRAQVTSDSKYAAAQTPMVRQYLDWSGRKEEIIDTGNLIFARVNPNKKEKRKIDLLPVNSHKTRVIVYAPSMKSRKSRRFFVLETLDELVSSIRDVIETVSHMPDALLVIRVHPGEPITRKEIEALIQLPSNVTISDTGSFESILTASDLVVSFSSTSIQESLINGVPVILYDKWARYNHLRAPRFEGPGKEPPPPAAAVYVDKDEYLYSAIRWMFDTRESGALCPATFRNYVFPAGRYNNFLNLIKKCTARNG